MIKSSEVILFTVCYILHEKRAMWSAKMPTVVIASRDQCCSFYLKIYSSTDVEKKKRAGRMHTSGGAAVVLGKIYCYINQKNLE